MVEILPVEPKKSGDHREHGRKLDIVAGALSAIGLTLIALYVLS